MNLSLITNLMMEKVLQHGLINLIDVPIPIPISNTSTTQLLGNNAQATLTKPFKNSWNEMWTKIPCWFSVSGLTLVRRETKISLYFYLLAWFASPFVVDCPVQSIAMFCI